MTDINDFVIILEKENIGYQLYRSKGCSILFPYECMASNKIVRKIKSIIVSATGNQLFGVNKRLKGASMNFIVYDVIEPAIVEFIRNNNVNARIIVYYSNPVKYSHDPREYDSSGVELWTFDDEDSKKYNMRWNPLHYFGTRIEQSTEKREDIVFVGADKGRYDTIRKLERTFRDMGLSTNIHITANSNTPFYNRKKYKKRLRYSENMELIFRAKAVLDITQPQQFGYTLRVPEAMVNHIKLITNNKFLKNYDFYSRKNIFILGEDEMESLPEFIQSGWDHSRDRVIENMKYEYWIEKFEIGNDAERNKNRL